MTAVNSRYIRACVDDYEFVKEISVNQERTRIDVLHDIIASYHNSYVAPYSRELEMVHHLSSDKLEEVIWAAGFFDGEGMATVSRLPIMTSGYHRYSVNANVRQKKRQVLDEIFLKNWRGFVSECDGCPRWSVNGKNAISFLQDVLPYLKVKWPVAERVVEFYKSQQSFWIHNNKRTINDEEEIRREKLVEEIRELNSRGDK